MKMEELLQLIDAVSESDLQSLNIKMKMQKSL